MTTNRETCPSLQWPTGFRDCCDHSWSRRSNIEPREYIVRWLYVLNESNSEQCLTLQVTYRSFDSLAYVLLFPRGTDSWRPGLKLSNVSSQRKKGPINFFIDVPRISTLRISKWVQNYTQRRAPFYQYVVDQYCKVELERHEYPRCNQTALHPASCISLCEQLGVSEIIENKVEVVRAERMFILPFTYVR